MKRIILFLAIIAGIDGLFEDQVGKFDWRARHVGCPNQVQLGRSASGKDFLIVASKKNALASINVNSGDINWRQIQEVTGTVAPVFEVYNPTERSTPFVASLINGGDYVRVFKRANGVLLWQQRIHQTSRKMNKLIVNKDLVVVVSENSALVFNAQTGEKRISTTLDAPDFVDGFVTLDGEINIVTVSGKSIKIHGVDVEAESLHSVGNIQLTIFPKSCALSGEVLACIDSTGSITAVGLIGTRVMANVLASAGSKIEKLDVAGYFAVSTSSNLVVYKFDDGKLKEILKAQPSSVFASVVDVENLNLLLAVYYDNQRSLKIFDLKSGAEKLSTRIEPLQQAPVDYLRILSAGKTLQLLTVRKDCRMDLYEINTDSGSKPTLEWTRFEALADVASVDMLDFPLSESQAMIETEFSGREANIIKTFFRRLTAQVEEIKRSALAFVDRVIKASDLLTKKHVTMSAIVNHLLGDDAAIRRMKKKRPGSVADASELGLERDYFNLRKIIVAASYSGSVYGINSEDGTILWSLYLGDDMIPLTNQFDTRKVPLFIQRGTAYYQHKSQALVVFGLRGSAGTRVIVFNPVTGEQIDTIQRNKLKRVELLPFADDSMIHPLLTIDISGKVEFYPRLEDTYPTSHPVHVFNYDVNGKISGGKLDLKTKKVVPTWSSKLIFGSNEKLVSVTGKPVNQKVHSSGRVLGDRSVMYKYSNPNLVAAESFDEETKTMSIYLIDTVTGQVVHTARHTKVRPPFHLVHCENWLIYTYWNEKARRTELGVIELFEGEEQTNADNFNSLTTTKSNVEAISKAYVFSQGVSAMQASETEMGLTYRSILIAMPFGGILEVPRRIADARRPLEMTPELREEMIIPYMPEIPIATEELINYNQTVEHIHGIKTAASGLESTSLMLAYGMDMFFTRVTPSGTFDILKDDFDYALIGGVMAILIISSFVVKRMWRQSSIRQAWA